MCGQVFADRISDEQKRLSDDGEKDIGKYRAALANVFDELTEAEVKQCEDLAIEWNTKPLPDEMQRKYVVHIKCNPSHSYGPYRLSKNIPADVTEFLKFMNSRTGAVFIAFAAYTNEDGQQTYGRHDIVDCFNTIGLISW